MSRSGEYGNIAALIRCSAEQLVKDKFLWRSNAIKTSPEEFAQMLLDAFIESVDNEREQYLRQLTDRLYRVNKERKSFEVEVEATVAAPDSEIATFGRQNDELKGQIVAFEEELKSLEWKYNRKQKFYKEKLKKKAAQIQNINELIERMSAAKHALSEQLGGLKASVVRMQRGQIRLAAQAKTMIAAHVEEAIEEQMVNCESQNAKQVAKVEDAVDEQEEKLKEAEHEAQVILDALEEMGVKVCSVEELPRKLNTIKANVQDVIEVKQKEAVENLRKEIAAQLPGIDVSSGNVVDAVGRHLAAKIKEKEKECNEVLRKGEARERKLRQQLDGAIAKIQKLQSSRNDDLAYLDEFEKSKRQYEEQQRRLDEQMSALGMGK